MNILSLFDGISIARVALERAGIPVEKYYASEIDRYAMQISAKNYPDIVQVGSVVGLDTAQFKDIGLLVGGSPCQDLSIAKKDRKGLDGERSGLFWEYVRILNEVKPRYFILENVNSMPKEAKALITETLGVEPIMIDAALVSAQRRKRLFWTNIPNVTQPEDRGILLKDILEDGDTILDRSMIGFEGKPRVYDKGKCPPITARMYKEPYSVVMKEKSNTIRSGGRSSGLGDKHEWDSVYQYRRTLTANMGTGGNNVPYVFDVYNDKIVPNNKAKTLGTNPQCRTAVAGQLVVDKSTIRKLSPLECERLQSLPDNYTEGVSNTQRYKALGNGFNAEVIAHILKFIPK